jgi:hypothetical protein
MFFIFGVKIKRMVKSIINSLSIKFKLIKFEIVFICIGKNKKYINILTSNATKSLCC